MSRNSKSKRTSSSDSRRDRTLERDREQDYEKDGSQYESDETKSKKGNHKSMGKRTNKRNKRVRDDKARSTNDISWYSANPDLLRDSASINFSWPTGNHILPDSVIGGTFYMNLSDRVPGVASVKLRPVYGNVGVGNQSSAVDPITVASKHLFSYLRADNTGYSNYNAPDFMIYCLAMSSIYSFIAWVRRLYAYMSLYDGKNKYLPKSLINGNSVDFESILNNLSTFRYWLNTFVKKVSAFAVPSTLYLFYRKAFLYQYLYTEGTSIKDQLYQFVPDGFEHFELNDNTHMGKLKYYKLPNRLMTVDDIITIGETMFAKIWNQEDFAIMSGDVLKKYGNNIIVMGPVDPDLSIAPVYDPLVLNQIKNGTYIDGATIEVSDLEQSANGVLYYTCNVVGGNSNFTTNIPPVLTINAPEVPPEIVMEATRLTACWNKSLESADLGIALGTEIIVGINVQDNPTITGVGTKIPAAIQPDFGAAGSPDAIKQLSLISQFDHLPRIFLETSDNESGRYLSILHDIDNYAVVDHTFLAKVHEAALLNMLDVPSVGKSLV